MKKKSCFLPIIKVSFSAKLMNNFTVPIRLGATHKFLTQEISGQYSVKSSIGIDSFVYVCFFYVETFVCQICGLQQPFPSEIFQNKSGRNWHTFLASRIWCLRDERHWGT